MDQPERRALGRRHVMVRCNRDGAAAPGLWVAAALQMFDESPAAHEQADKFLARVGDKDSEQLAHRLLLSLLRFEQGQVTEGRELLATAAANLPPRDRVVAALDVAQLVMNGQLAREATKPWQLAIADFFNPQLVRVLQGKSKRR